MHKLFEKFKERTDGQSLFAFHVPYSPLLTAVPWFKENRSMPRMPILFINKGRDTRAVINYDFSIRIPPRD